MIATTVFVSALWHFVINICDTAQCCQYFHFVNEVLRGAKVVSVVVVRFILGQDSMQQAYNIGFIGRLFFRNLFK